MYRQTSKERIQKRNLAKDAKYKQYGQMSDPRADKNEQAVEAFHHKPNYITSKGEI